MRVCMLLCTPLFVMWNLFPALIVIWNFPALLLDRAYGSHVKHRQLLLDFLKNMRQNVDTKPSWICPLADWALPLRLEIWLTLHGRQAAHDQWQLDRQCEAAGMVIKETHPFRVDDFPGYQRSFQPMNDVGSTTYVIVPRDCHAPPHVPPRAAAGLLRHKKAPILYLNSKLDSERTGRARFSS